MQQHIKILAVLHIVFGGLGLFAALIVLMVFGGVAVGGHSGTAPLNYLQIYGKDITYATNNFFGKQPVMMGTATNMMSAQDLLDMASRALAMIAEH